MDLLHITQDRQEGTTRHLEVMEKRGRPTALEGTKGRRRSATQSRDEGGRPGTRPPTRRRKRRRGRAAAKPKTVAPTASV